VKSETETASFKGMAVSAVNLIHGNQTGISIGLVNYASQLKGVQLGLINIADNNKNIFRILPLVNAHF